MSFQSHHMLRLATTSVDHKPTTTAPRPTRFDQPDPALIRADLEAMRQDFQELLYALSDRDLRQRRFASAACSVSDLLTQTIAELARIPATVDGLRQDRKVERMPAWLFILLRIVRSRLGGPRTTCASLRDELDRAMDVALVALESIQGEEWQLGAHLYAEGYCPLAWIFTRPIYHFAKYVVTIRQILAQEARLAKVIAVQLF